MNRRARRWFLYSTREGVLAVPAEIKRLPRTARVSADENWAELDGSDGLVERVFMKLTTAIPVRQREGVAW